ncbi:MAG: hypothetical protein HQK91_07885 [Nitrospirae bacterium]|nr:hypothetical protein [Nitrospirota bacterium]MBF0541354.1 hypothetical protein [Nitrospirota bacterium]
MRKQKITVNIYAIIILISLAIILLTSCSSSEKKMRITGIKTESGTLIIIEHGKE